MENITSNNRIWIDHTVALLRWVVIVNTVTKNILHYVFNLFLIFVEKSFAFPENVNEEVSSNNKDKFATMMAAMPKISYAVSHYDSHHLRSNVQFSAIETIMQSIKTEPSIIYLVPDHKKNQMRYW